MDNPLITFLVGNISGFVLAEIFNAYAFNKLKHLLNETLRILKLISENIEVKEDKH